MTSRTLCVKTYFTSTHQVDLTQLAIWPVLVSCKLDCPTAREEGKSRAHGFARICGQRLHRRFSSRDNSTLHLHNTPRFTTLHSRCPFSRPKINLRLNQQISSQSFSTRCMTNVSLFPTLRSSARFESRIALFMVRDQRAYSKMSKLWSHSLIAVSGFQATLV